MAANRFRGEVKAPIIGTLCYDYEALARLFDELGAEWPEELTKAQLRKDIRTIVKIAEIGSDKSADQIIEASPPLSLLCVAITEAINLSFNGVEENKGAKRGDAEENPPSKSRTGNGSSRKPSAPLTASDCRPVISGG